MSRVIATTFAGGQGYHGAPPLHYTTRGSMNNASKDTYADTALDASLVPFHSVIVNPVKKSNLHLLQLSLCTSACYYVNYNLPR